MHYHVHNTSRALASRAQRYTSPTHRGMVQFMGGQRIIRGRPLVIDETTLQSNLVELKARVAGGYIEVRTPDGRKVNLDTLVPEPAPASPALPVFVPDSVNNDTPAGRPMPIYPDGAVQSSKPVPQETPVIVEAEVQLDAPEPQPLPPVQASDSVDVEYQEEGGGVPKKGGRGKRR